MKLCNNILPDEANKNIGSLDVSDNVAMVICTVAISSPHRSVPSRRSERGSDAISSCFMACSILSYIDYMNSRDLRQIPGQHHLLFAALAICVTIQICGIAFLSQGHANLDTQEYLSISRSLVEGNGYGVVCASFTDFDAFRGESPTRMRQPGYPFYLVLFYWLTGQRDLIVQISQIILNLLTLVVAYRIALGVYGERSQNATLLLLAAYFPLWVTSAFILTESLFTFLLVSTMYLLWRATTTQSRLLHFGATGAGFAAMLLTRPIAMLPCLLCLIPLWAHLGFRKSVRWWGLQAAVCLVLVAPWFIRNSVSLGDYTLLSSDGGYNLWYSSVPDSAPKWFDSPQFAEIVGDGYYLDRAANERFTQKAIVNIKADPGNYAARALVRPFWTWSYFPGSRQYRDLTALFIALNVVHYAILLLAAVGITTASRRDLAYLLLPVVSLSIVLTVSKGISRFIVPAMPFVLILAGQGIDRIWRLARRRS